MQNPLSGYLGRNENDENNDNSYREYAISNQTLIDLITKQLHERDSVLLRALRLIQHQRYYANRTGPYAYVPAIIGTPYEHYSQKMLSYGELALISFVFFLWIISIMLCMKKYKKLRSIEPLVPAYNKGPKHIEEIKICENAGESVIYQKVKYERSSRNSEVNSTPTQTINYIITTAKNLKELSELDKGAQITELTELISQHRSASSLASTLTTRLNAQLDNKSSSHQYMNKSFCLPIHATSITSANSPSHSYRLMPKATPKIKMYMRERNWTFGANTSYELNRVKKNRNITGDDVGGGGNTPSFIANKLAGNFSTPNKNSGNYKRVLDKRHLYAKSKYFVKRNGTDETEAFKTTQSSSLKKSSQDSVTISIKEKSKKSVDSPVANTTLNSSNEITNNRDRIEFVDRNERDGNIQRHKSSLNNEDTAILSGISANSVLKSPDLLNPNWIPLRVRTNLIELHRNLYRNRTPLQLSSISKSESNLRQSSRSRELIPEKLLSLQNSQDNGTNV